MYWILEIPLILCIFSFSSFNINNHIVLSARTYRGRPVSDSNIQDFVSELATKYIPSDLPQWQVIIIPTASTTSNTANTPETGNENTTPTTQTMVDILTNRSVPISNLIVFSFHN